MKRWHVVGLLAALGLLAAGWGLAAVILWGSVRGLR